MSQLQIDFLAPAPVSFQHLARRNDPQTSKDAAARVAEFAAGHRAEILAALKRGGPSSPERLAEISGLDRIAICRRLPELERDGTAAPTGETVPTKAGRSQRVWKAL